MALTWNDLNGKVQDKIIPTVVDVVYKASPVFIRIRTQNGQQFDGGVQIRQNIGYAELNGGPFGRGGTFNTDYVPTDTADLAIGLCSVIQGKPFVEKWVTLTKQFRGTVSVIK